MSLYLARLDEELAQQPEPWRRAELRTRRAAYIARIGRFDEARTIVSEVREAFGGGQSGRVAVRLMLAEGLIHAFERYAPEAGDRIMRAQALAIAMRQADLSALASAWRAHCQLERSEFAGMVRSLQTALGVADDDDHDAQTRIAMTLASAFAACGEATQAAAWYAASRHHALAAGDRATIEAMLYNKSSYAMAWFRAQACVQATDAALAGRIRREIASARNLHLLEGVEAGTPYMRLWEARALIATGAYAEAQPMLEEARRTGGFADYNVSEALLGLEIAYCMSRQGATEQAAARFADAAQADFSTLHDDDQLVAAWLLAELSLLHAAFGDPATRAAQLEVARTMFAHFVDELRMTLQPLRGIRVPGVPEAILKTFS